MVRSATSPAKHSEPAHTPKRSLDEVREHWLEAFRRVRAETERRASHLSPEDQIVQSMADASPAKWHRAHVTWFFEQFLLVTQDPDYKIFDERFPFLFNSYYVAAGPRHARPQRGLITRPHGEDVAAYRAHVDAAVDRLIARVPAADAERVFAIVEIGLHHEQQHQELLITDILHAFAQNPTDPAYDPDWQGPRVTQGPRGYVEVPSGIHAVGHDGEGFCFDNETPLHDELIPHVRIARHLVTNAEWAEFIAAGGYTTPSLWLSDGWTAVQAEGWQAPGYWREKDGGWHAMTLAGLKPIDPDSPVQHQLLRSRCVRAVCRQTSSERGRVGGGCARERGRRCFWHRLAMDAECLSTVSGLSGSRRRARRIQWKIHDQSDGSARLIVGNPGCPCARELSEFLLSIGTLAIQRSAFGRDRVRRHHGSSSSPQTCLVAKSSCLRI